MKVDLTCPIELSEYRLPTAEDREARFDFLNLSAQGISSVQITATYYDDGDEVITRRVERPMAIGAAPKSRFTVAHEVQSEGIASVSLVIDKVWFENGTEWRRSQQAHLTEYTPNDLPPGRRLEELRHVAGKDAVGYPQRQGSIWLCLCGRVNSVTEAACRRCGRRQDEVFAKYSETAIAENIAEREHALEEKARAARSEASRQEFLQQDRKRRERRRRRIGAALVFIALALGITAYLFVTFGLPEVRYQMAYAQYTDGSIQDARTRFAELDDYRDAPEMVTKCDLELSRRQIASGDPEKIAAALETLSAMDGYGDSADLIREGRYQQAVATYNKGDYEAAIEQLTPMGDYKQAADMIRTARYTLATEAYNRREYDAARAMYEELGSYSDSEIMAMECVYQPALVLRQNGNYEAAIEAFGKIAGYRDADTQRLQCIYESALQAQNAGNYDYAAERFALLGNFADADDQVRQSVYLAAERAFSQQNYETAATLYETILGYKDAANKSMECVYIPAVALMEAGEYEAASAMFSRIRDPEYKDVRDRIYDCVYLPGMAAMDAGNYAEAIAYFSRIPEYKDSESLVLQARYQMAEQSLGRSEFENALAQFTALGDYSDASDRVLDVRYRIAEKNYDAGEYETARGQFAELGKYAEAGTMVKRCEFELANLLVNDGDLEGALAAYEAIEDYEPAAQAALSTRYILGEKAQEEGDLEKAISIFTGLGSYQDAAERVSECVYRQATDLMEAGEYKQAAARFRTVRNFRDAESAAAQCDDLWLKSIADRMAKLFAQGDYPAVIAEMEDNGIAAEDIPETYAGTLEQYNESCYQLAKVALDEERWFDAYPYLVRCSDYRNVPDLLHRMVYMLLGTWQNADGSRTVAFYTDGTCVIDGEVGRFTVKASNRYAIYTGEAEGDLRKTLTTDNVTEHTLSLKDLKSGRTTRFERIRGPESYEEAQAAGNAGEEAAD